MTCYLKFLNAVMKLARVDEKEARKILGDIEKEQGHNANLIKAVVDFEGANLRKRLRKTVVRGKAASTEEVAKAYA